MGRSSFIRRATRLLSLLIVAIFASATLPVATSDVLPVDKVTATVLRVNQTLSAGAGHLCSISSTGTLACWGLNLDGQVGDGTTAIRDTFTQVGVAGDWLTVSAGNRFTCAIREVNSERGSLWCWGINTYGQLGLGNTTSEVAPQQVGTATNWVAVSTGRDHACAIKSDGEMFCWGRDNLGQVGNGSDSSGNVLVPTQVGDDQAWTRVSSGYGSTIAIDDNGALWGWGLNDAGQLGDGTTIDRAIPTRIGADTDWAETIATRPYDWSPHWWWPISPFYSCALKIDGSLWCAGDNSSGQFGNGTWDSSLVFIRSGGDEAFYVSASASESYMCGVQTEGSLWCWGWNSYATIAPSSEREYPDPERIGEHEDWVTVTAGPSGDLDVNPYYFNAGACAMNESGHVYCWGSNMVGQQGRGLWARDIGGSWASVTAGRGYSCGIHGDSGVAECWGTNDYGRMGSGRVAGDVDAEPVAISSDSVAGWSSIAAARYLTCGIASAGTDVGSGWCWGNTRSGGLGNGVYSGINQRTPVRIGDASCASEPGCDYDFQWAMISTGTFSACGITATGELWCWGEGRDGELGDGQNGMQTYDYYYEEPHRSVNLFRVGTAGGGTPSSDWIDIASTNTGVAGGQARCGIREIADGAGTLWCWGGGPIGGGNLVPAKVGTDEDWSNVVLGSQHACATKRGGSLWCWGTNLNGELGLGAVGSQAVPTQVGSASDWIDIAVGWEVSCGIRNHVDEYSSTSNTLYCWGDNGHNILGLPVTVEKSEVPMRVAVDFNPERVSMTEDHACTYGDGAIGCHGSAYEAQLGTWLAREGTSSTMLLPTSARIPRSGGGSNASVDEPKLTALSACGDHGTLPASGSEMTDVVPTAARASVRSNVTVAGDSARPYGKVLTTARLSGVRLAKIGSHCAAEIITRTGVLQIFDASYLGSSSSRVFIWSEEAGWENLAKIEASDAETVTLPPIRFDQTGHYVIAVTDGTGLVGSDEMWGTRSVLISVWVTTPKFVVTFAPDSSRLSVRAKKVLRSVVEEIKLLPSSLSVVVRGFLNPFIRRTQSLEELPLTLADQRADRIARYLQKIGLEIPIVSRTSVRGSNRSKTPNRKGVIVINWGTGT